ncbi:extracellular solute-binding protein family 1 [Xylanimonas cellulosilytica DSM 15894]|uniref:Extracellular solute-binding protein family 1 n=1 Tax=Xylanimonas cellulosilytica (strain DSM 15894 / JCM 12276 / CECT 5975 / KCTC 9989 / LMG 20990 / NBRC 107835 / XIL07) TaxID=446471 RepID=D1BUB9_XYLCX|nr:sugar ABC transporter substrate-binding protein [Xylanimonas cellulosilytica]ACZ31132.1 extracellular solute-binding protein family 1 [Xylanimonas cellulosilytica DSM 15894]
MSSRKLVAAVASVAAGLTLAGCGLSGAQAGGTDAGPSADGEITGDVTFQTWALKAGFSDYIEGVIADFEAAYPGTHVTWIDQPGDGYADKLLAQAAAGELPDVVNTTPAFGYQLANEDLLQDLSALDGTLDETYVPGSLEGFQFAGLDGTFGYPWYLSSELNYWNTDILAEAGIDPKAPPATFDELVTASQALKEASDGEAYLMSKKPNLGDFASAGIQVINEDGTEFVFNSDEAVALLDKYVHTYADGLMPADVLTDKFLGDTELFKKGTVGWTATGGNYIASAVKDNPSLEGKFAVSPHFGTAPIAVQGLSIPRTTKNLPTAIALAQFVTNAVNQEAFAELVPGIFPSTSASQSADLAKSDGTPEGDAKAIAFESLSTAKVMEPVQITTAMSTAINQEITAALTGQTTSKEALDNAVERCNQLLAE